MPVTNLNSFNRAIATVTKNMPAEQTKLVQRKLALDLLRGIIEKSLVDTGLSRGNWHVSVGSPTTKLFAVRAPGLAVGAAMASLQKLGDFDVVFVQNNVHYVGYLEHGTPKIPAVAMVARTVVELETALLGAAA